jgi:hypothetical protein
MLGFRLLGLDLLSWSKSLQPLVTKVAVDAGAPNCYSLHIPRPMFPVDAGMTLGKLRHGRDGTKDAVPLAHGEPAGSRRSQGRGAGMLIVPALQRGTRPGRSSGPCRRRVTEHVPGEFVGALLKLADARPSSQLPAPAGMNRCRARGPRRRRRVVRGCRDEPNAPIDSTPGERRSPLTGRTGHSPRPKRFSTSATSVAWRFPRAPKRSGRGYQPRPAREHKRQVVRMVTGKDGRLVARVVAEAAFLLEG